MTKPLNLRYKDMDEIVTIATIALKFYPSSQLHKGKEAVQFWRRKLGIEGIKTGGELLLSPEDGKLIEERLSERRAALHG